MYAIDPISHGVGHRMLVSNAFHVVLAVLVLAIEGSHVYDTWVIDKAVTLHSPNSAEVEVMRSPPPFGELVTPYFLIDGTGISILSPHPYHLLILDVLLSVVMEMNYMP